MSSLQDQLLKAGLTTKQKARQANSDKRKRAKQKRSGKAVDATLQEQVQQDLQKAASEKKAAELAKVKIQQAEKEQKELDLRIAQILNHHSLKDFEGENAYNYTFENKIKKLFVNDKTQQALINGRLAICGHQEGVYVVTSETAQKLATLKASVVVLLNDAVASDEVEEDDPYAEYQIPDDLMW